MGPDPADNSELTFKQSLLPASWEVNVPKLLLYTSHQLAHSGNFPWLFRHAPCALLPLELVLEPGPRSGMAHTVVEARVPSGQGPGRGPALREAPTSLSIILFASSSCLIQSLHRTHFSSKETGLGWCSDLAPDSRLKRRLNSDFCDCDAKPFPLDPSMEERGALSPIRTSH